MAAVDWIVVAAFLLGVIAVGLVLMAVVVASGWGTLRWIFA